jgi:hypothetical protein
MLAQFGEVVEHVGEAAVIGLEEGLQGHQGEPLVDQLRAYCQALGVERAEERHGSGPLHYAGQVGDAILMEADLVRRLLRPSQFRPWFHRFI